MLNLLLDSGAVRPRGLLFKKHLQKVARVILTMFEPTAGRLQLDIKKTVLVNIYTDRYVGNEGIYIVLAIHCVHPLGRMHTIIVHIAFQFIL